MNMAKIKSRVIAFVSEEDGATAIEYALIAALIAIAIVAAVQSAGISIRGLFQNVATTLSTGTGTGGGGGGGS